MNWAWSQDGMSPTEKLVLMALADHSDNNGICWPGLDGLAEKCGVSTRTVIRAIATLEETGRVVKRIRPGEGSGRKSNVYSLNMESGQCANLSHSHRGNVTTMLGNVTPVSPEPSIEPSQEEEGVAASIQLGDGSSYDVTVDLVAELRETYPNVDISRELSKMRQWCLANPARRKTRRGVRRFINGWCSRAEDKANEKRTQHRKNGNGKTRDEVHRDYLRQEAEKLAAEEMDTGAIRETPAEVWESVDKAGGRESGGYRGTPAGVGAGSWRDYSGPDSCRSGQSGRMAAECVSIQAPVQGRDASPFSQTDKATPAPGSRQETWKIRH